uniref:Uncharacterized protein n=1 Tax=Arundo donax TaxID=35708 RepID=A0A0A8ZJA4_ARUDO
MIFIRSFVTAAGSFSGRVNPLRVGLLSENLSRSELLSLQDSCQWA